MDTYNFTAHVFSMQVKQLTDLNNQCGAQASLNNNRAPRRVVLPLLQSALAQPEPRSQGGKAPRKRGTPRISC